MFSPDRLYVDQAFKKDSTASKNNRHHTIIKQNQIFKRQKENNAMLLHGLYHYRGQINRMCQINIIELKNATHYFNPFLRCE